MYDDVLRLPLPAGVKIVGFADDITQVIYGESIEEVESKQRALISVGDCTIDSKRSLKHIGVIIDDKLSYASHVEYASKRASTAIAALSILRYGGPIWSKALQDHVLE